MKDNRFKQVCDAGGIPLGHMIMEFGTRGIAHLLDAAGLDFVLIDMEHTSFTLSQVADLIGWFRATAIAPFVRIPQIEHHFIARLLDAGALGLMIPDVQTAEEAQLIVNAAKFPPIGERGLIAGVAHTDYKAVDAGEFMTYANDNLTIICQIESQAGLDNLDAIANTSGVDVLWVGQNDLSQNLGIRGQFQHEKFLAALRQVVEAGQKHGCAIGAQPRSLEQAAEWRDLGFDVFSFSNDLSVYRNALNQSIAEMRGLVKSDS